MHYFNEGNLCYMIKLNNIKDESVNQTRNNVESSTSKLVPSQKEGYEWSSQISSLNSSQLAAFESTNRQDILNHTGYEQEFVQDNNDIDDAISIATSAHTEKISNTNEDVRCNSRQTTEMPFLSSPNLTSQIAEATVKKTNKNMLKKTGKAIQRILTRPQTNKNVPINLTSKPGMKQNNIHSLRQLRPRLRSENALNLRSPHVNLMDDAIRGRLDGLDIIFLGSARSVSYISSRQAQYSGQRYTLRSMITDSLTYGKTTNVMIVLEGYISSERWSVYMEALPSDSNKINDEKKSFDYIAENDYNSTSDPSTEELENTEDVPTYDLLNHMWGKDNLPPPSNNLMMKFTKQTNISEYLIAANCPIDVDDNLLMIDSIERLKNIIDVAVSPLRNGCFEDAIEIFGKILQSLNEQHMNYIDNNMSRKEILIAATHHNIATLQMWAGMYEDALLSLKESIRIRLTCFSEYHPLVAVTYCKLGLVQFSLEQLDAALESFERVIKIQRLINSSELEMAKVLCNIGATQYQKGDMASASKYFRESHELQRRWIESPIKRESNVYEAGVTLCNMGKVFLEKNDFDMSFHSYEEALMLQATSFKKDHDIVLLSLGNIAFAKAKKGERTKALKIYKGIHRAQVRKFGAESREAVETIGLISVIHIQQRDYHEAIKCLYHVMEWQVANLDEHHLAIRNTKETIMKITQEIHDTAN